MYISQRAYPYIPDGRTIDYVPVDNIYMAHCIALRQTLLERYPDMTVTASIIVKNGRVIGRGTNRPVHDSFCPRTALGYQSGVGYELCPNFCHPNNHSEAQTIRDAIAHDESTKSADLYLTGHWWICKPCWEKIISAEIKKVYLIEGATEKFFRNVAPKGEPQTAVRVKLVGITPDKNLTSLLRSVLVTIVDDQDEADACFTADPSWTQKQLLVELSRALANAGVYRKS